MTRGQKRLTSEERDEILRPVVEYRDQHQCSWDKAAIACGMTPNRVFYLRNYESSLEHSRVGARKWRARMREAKTSVSSHKRTRKDEANRKALAQSLTVVTPTVLPRRAAKGEVEQPMMCVMGTPQQIWEFIASVR